MAAFDALPPRVRQALNLAQYPISAVEVRQLAQSPDHGLELIRLSVENIHNHFVRAGTIPPVPMPPPVPFRTPRRKRRVR